MAPLLMRTQPTQPNESYINSVAPVRALIGFPILVIEKAARTVATGVLALSALTLITGWYWLTIPLAYGFWARVLTGPKLSPLGWSAMNVIAPRLGEKVYVAGPPKRF